MLNHKVSPSFSPKVHSSVANEFVPCDTKRMATGKIVLIITKRLGGGPPAKTLYAIAEADAEEAKKIVDKAYRPTRDEIVEVVGSLSENAVQALQLEPGQLIVL